MEKINNLNNGWYLPKVQRQYVWGSRDSSEEYICLLVDSLLRGYPIGGLVLWETTSKIPYRKFIEDFSEGTTTRIVEEDFRGNAKSWSDLAILLGISRRTLLRKRKEPNAPQGYGDVEAWVKFLNGSESDNSLKRLNEARLRILNAQAAEREFRLKVLEGKYVEIDDVRETWSAHIHQAIALMRSKFENELPPVYTLEPVANMKLNQEAIDEICRTMSDGGKYTP